MQEPIYIDLSQKIASLIERNIYKAGDKLPSLRTLHKENGISVGTVLQAFNHLIDKGYLTSREKSGYFVSYRNRQNLPAPQAIPATLSARSVHIDKLLRKLREGGSKKEFVSLANALPDHRLLPFNSIKSSIQKVSKDLSGNYLKLEDPKGNRKLREAIAKRSFTWNGKLHADDLIITNGTTEALNICLKAVTNPGDTVLVQSPCYYGIMLALEGLGLKVITIPCHSDSGIDVDVLVDVCRSMAVKACILVSNFNNPNGASLNSIKKARLAAFAAKYKIPIIEDDIYGDICFSGKRPDCIKSYDESGWVMYCSSFSKSLAPGFRIGWCAPGRFSYEVARIKLMQNSASNTLMQSAIYELLESGSYDRHLKKFRLELQKNMVRTIRLVEKHFPVGTRISSPAGGLVVWAELPAPINTTELQDTALDQGVSYGPGELFSNDGDYKNYLRISYCNQWDAKIERALENLGGLFSAISINDK